MLWKQKSVALFNFAKGGTIGFVKFVKMVVLGASEVKSYNQAKFFKQRNKETSTFYVKKDESFLQFDCLSPDFKDWKLNWKAQPIWQHSWSTCYVLKVRKIKNLHIFQKRNEFFPNSLL